jgi:hypothetical protein
MYVGVSDTWITGSDRFLLAALGLPDGSVTTASGVIARASDWKSADPRM